MLCFVTYGFSVCIFQKILNARRAIFFSGKICLVFLIIVESLTISICI